MADPTHIYYGLREDMLAEASAWDPMEIGIAARECKYLAMPYGGEQYDTQWFRTKADVKLFVAEVARSNSGIKVCRV